MPDDQIYVVEDDAAMRRSIVFLAESVGWSARGFASAEDFLKETEPEQGACLILDIRMPTMSGLELQRTLNARGAAAPPIVFITCHGDVAMAVQAMKARWISSRNRSRTSSCSTPSPRRCASAASAACATSARPKRATCWTGSPSASAKSPAWWRAVCPTS